MPNSLIAIPIPDFIPVCTAARLCGMATATFKSVVVDEFLVEMWAPYADGRRHVRRESLESFLGHTITEEEFYEACQTRRAARDYQRRYRLEQARKRQDA